MRGLRAAPLPYVDLADDRGATRASLSAVGAGQERVFIIFDANACEDCRSLDQALKNR